MTKATGSSRVKKSYSLSGEAVAFVARIRRARKIGSDSETLDLLIRQAMEIQRKSKVDAAYKAYYDMASDADLAEESSWAEFSGAEWAEVAQ